jgi:peptide/nickel transport system permease protein
MGPDTVLGQVVRRPVGLIGVAIVGVLVVLAVFGEQLAPYDASAQDIVHRFEGPSSAHWLGTDGLGRDLFSRILVGARIAMMVALPGVLAALVLGLLIGTIAGFIGGRMDRALIVVMDALQAFPSVVLALVLVAVLNSSLTNLAVVVAVTFAPQFARVARASVLTLREQPFIEAERALGVGSLRIMRVHVLPNILAPLFILFAMNIPSAITVEAGLSFLGMGVQPPTPSWGVLLRDGFDSLYSAPWAVIFTGVAISVTTIGFTALGETLRDVSDPKLAGLKGARYDG